MKSSEIEGYTKIIDYADGGGVFVPTQDVKTQQIQDFVKWSTTGRGPLRTGGIPKDVKVSEPSNGHPTEYFKHEA